MSELPTPSAQRRSERFLVNVLWNGLGFLVSIISGILLSPYIIWKLGPEGYGVWSLVFALVDYLWLSDLGFRSSVLKFSAHYLAKDEPEKINQVVNTALVYFSAAAAVLLGLTVWFSRSVPQFFQLSESYRGVFSFMLMVVGCSWAFGLINNTFRASLEGFQEYGLINRITIAMVGVRAAGCAVLLWRGYGLRELGIMVVVAQVMGYALTFACFRRAFPGSRFSRSLVNGPMLRQMLGYGIHTFVATVATQLLNQGPPLLIGHLRSATWVGFFNLPVRLLMNTVDAAAQVGMITGAGSADLAARGELPAVARMGVYVNRYCFMLYLPLVILTGFYSRELFLLWVGPVFAQNSAPLLPVMAVAIAIGVAGQQNSSAILYGLGKHQKFALGLLAEAVVGIGGIIYILPRYGLLGIAYWSAALMILNRGLWAPWLVSEHLGVSFAGFMRGIYTRPLAAALPVVGAAVLMRASGIRGTTWAQLFLAAAVIALAYYGICFFVCVQRDHRALLLSRLRKLLLRPQSSP